MADIDQHVDDNEELLEKNWVDICNQFYHNGKGAEIMEIFDQSHSITEHEPYLENYDPITVILIQKFRNNAIFWNKCSSIKNQIRSSMHDGASTKRRHEFVDQCVQMGKMNENASNLSLIDSFSILINALSSDVGGYYYIVGSAYVWISSQIGRSNSFSCSFDIHAFSERSPIIQEASARFLSSYSKYDTETSSFIARCDISDVVLNRMLRIVRVCNHKHSLPSDVKSQWFAKYSPMISVLQIARTNTDGSHDDLLEKLYHSMIPCPVL